MKNQLSVNLGNLLLSLSETPNISNPSISQHQHRVAYIALEIANYANLNQEFTENIFTAALLHDIGAISVEEKISVHDSKYLDNNIHTIRGEILLEEIPWLKRISKIVRNHHKDWNKWDQDIDSPIVLASQIILLSDFVERYIDRNKYILHQNIDIIDAIKKLEGKTIHKKVIDYFVEVSKREDFWLDLVSPKLYQLLLQI
jgi:response regulator RpfG family c-di-GMP phosphodiesterase